MPATAEILTGLTAIANQYIGVAIVWHVLLAVGFGATLLGWKPSSRTAGSLLSLLPLSVATLAWMSDNPFNATTLGVLAIVLLWTSLVHRPVAVALGMPWLGGALIAYGWIYPHFLEARPILTYVAAAPLGIVPCPTLAVLIGLALRKPRSFSRVWMRALVVVGVFYAAFGVLRLGVWLDVGLLIGAAALFHVARTETALARQLAAA